MGWAHASGGRCWSWWSCLGPGVTPRVPQDNRSLKEQNDELNGQIINLSIQGAKNLFSTAFSESLAAEISSVSRDEVTPHPIPCGRPQSGHLAPTPVSSHSSWTPSRSRRRSTSACRTTSTGSSWPSWRPTRPSWRSSSATWRGSSTARTRPRPRSLAHRGAHSWAGQGRVGEEGCCGRSPWWLWPLATPSFLQRMRDSLSGWGEPLCDLSHASCLVREERNEMGPRQAP